MMGETLWVQKWQIWDYVKVKWVPDGYSLHRDRDDIRKFALKFPDSRRFCEDPYRAYADAETVKLVDAAGCGIWGAAGSRYPEPVPPEPEPVPPEPKGEPEIRWVQKWETWVSSYERWEPNGYSLHKNKEDIEKYARQFSHSRPRGDPYTTRVDAEIAKLVDESGGGIWGPGSAPDGYFILDKGNYLASKGDEMSKPEIRWVQKWETWSLGRWKPSGYTLHKNKEDIEKYARQFFPLSRSLGDPYTTRVDAEIAKQIDESRCGIWGPWSDLPVEDGAPSRYPTPEPKGDEMSTDKDNMDNLRRLQSAMRTGNTQLSLDDPDPKLSLLLNGQPVFKKTAWEGLLADPKINRAICEYLQEQLCELVRIDISLNEREAKAAQQRADTLGTEAKRLRQELEKVIGTEAKRLSHELDGP